MARLQARRANRRGTYAAIFGVSTAMLLGFTAIAIDVGWQRLAMTQLANAADAGAHAGALELDGTAAGITAARARAEAVAEANLVHGLTVDIDATNDVVFGRFDSNGENDCTTAGGCWTPHGSVPSGYSVTMTDPVNDETTNAVYVGAEEDVKTFFAMFPFGRSEIQAANYAIARLPIVDGIPCAFPISLPECSMTDWTGGDPCGKLIRLQRTNSNVDNMAWSTPDGIRGASVIKEAIATVDGSCGTEYDGGGQAEDTRLTNGNVSSAQAIIAAQLAGATYNQGGLGPYDYGAEITPGWDSTWGACPTGNLTDHCDPTVQNAHCPSALPDCSSTTTDRMIKRQVSVFQHGGYGCDANGNITFDSNYNDTVTTSGFVNLIIYAAGSSGGTQYLDAYISCTDEQGNLRDDNNDGSGDVIHQGDPTIDDPGEGTVAIVE